ncbi:neuropeptide SIFamide receptor-like [Lytechinus variegatus]|uniref:neuropeptide SIFamide receptor-like n=1 Tax=Lytechinus variegatus TaxID=7654 RepID=UPI001BB133B8|nr:neuropeptide SIFamide receptor-like [Lytechinus variegatus]XP_041462372.1 neuropeptide SIFamide receptor-like [Lytechinus variegatus]
MTTLSPATSPALTISELATTITGGVSGTLPDADDVSTTVAATTMSGFSSSTQEASDNSGWSSGFDDQVWIKFCYGVIAVLGIFGNFMVMFTVARVRSLRTLTNMFIVSLAAADFITSVFLIPLHLGKLY